MSPATVADGPSDNSAFCASFLDLMDAFSASPLTGENESAEPPESSVAIEAAENLSTVVAASSALAPEELRPAFDLVATSLERIRETGDTSGFMDDEMSAETSSVDLWVYDNCGWAQLPVTAVDYAFEGFPPTLPPGTTAIKLTNDGGQFHVMLVVRREPGSTATLDDLFAYEGDGIAPGFELAAAAGAAPGSFGLAVGDLTPGEYFALNPIPKDGDQVGKPLAAEGMVVGFTVE